ncbi:MAG: hypothetical protein Q7R40_20170 [Phaeospirillum sp.]|nr:hypothetical protein [Phaeospirillum sp.]
MKYKCTTCSFEGEGGLMPSVCPKCADPVEAVELNPPLPEQRQEGVVKGDDATDDFESVADPASVILKGLLPGSSDNPGIPESGKQDGMALPPQEDGQVDIEDLLVPRPGPGEDLHDGQLNHGVADEDIPKIKLLLDSKRSGNTIITIIGFYHGGKSFILNRIARMWANDGRYVYSDGECKYPVEVGGRVIGTPLGIHPTKFYSHVREHESGVRHIQFIDMAGETFTGPLGNIQEGHQEDPAQGGDIFAGHANKHEFVASLALSDAFIFVIPATSLASLRLWDHEDEADDDLKDTAKVVNRFTTFANMICHYESLMKDSIPELQEFLDLISKDYVEGDDSTVFRKDGKYVSRKAVYVALSKGDLFVKEFANHNVDDSDPAFFLRDTANRLYETIKNRFSSFRVDFVTAQEGAKSDKVTNGRAFGVEALLKWVRWVSMGTIPYGSPLKRFLHSHLHNEGLAFRLRAILGNSAEKEIFGARSREW